MLDVTTVKKHRGSKNRKKSWKKVDIEDVEDFLESKRLEERLGGAFEDRTNEELFVLDTTPSTKLEVGKDAKKTRRQALLDRPPRCFQILESYSKVPDPYIKRNRVRTAEERKHPVLRVKESEQRGRGILKRKELDAIRNRQKFDEEQHLEKPRRGDVSRDLWTEADTSVAARPELQSEWLETLTLKHTLVGLGQARKAPPKSMSVKPYQTPSVEVPHPGMSYNPSYDDHVDLLQGVASREQELMKKERHLRRVTSKMFKKVSPEQAAFEWTKEMSQGVPSLDPEAAKRDDIDCREDNELRAINPPTDRSKKKTRKTRRKIKEEHQRLGLRLRLKQERKKVSDIHNLKNLKESVLKAEEKLSKLRENRAKKQAAYDAGTKRLGPNKFIEKDLDFNMCSDLHGNLRCVKPEGNLLLNRFTSMQKRNLMEVPSIQKLRVGKTKRFVKPSHKLPWEVDTLQIRRKNQQSKIPLGNKLLGIKY